MQALLLPLASDLYALELQSVREVVPAPALTPLPGAPDAVLGIFSLRGDVIPALDTAFLLGLGRLASSPYVAVVDAPAGVAGLAADEVPRTVELGEPAGRSELPGASGRFAVPGGVATLLSVDALLPGRLDA